MVGSAVIEFLSLNASGSVSSISVIGADQVRPPSVERLTSVALSPLIGGDGLLLNASEKKYAVPSSPNAVHGSVERCSRPPVQSEMPCGTVVVQFLPLLTLTAPRRPRAPPLLQRSCCYAGQQMPRGGRIDGDPRLDGRAGEQRAGLAAGLIGGAAVEDRAAGDLHEVAQAWGQ